jgi:hypothetical protein
MKCVKIIVHMGAGLRSKYFICILRNISILNLKANKKQYELQNISVSKTGNEVLIIKKEIESTETRSLHITYKVTCKPVETSFC